MDDAAEMGDVDGIADFDEKFQQLVDRQVRAGHVGVERPAGDVVHDVKGVARGKTPVVNRHDVRMIEPAKHIDFEIEACQLGSVGKGSLPQDLDGHLPSRRFLERLIDHALTAAVDFAKNSKAGNRDRLR